MTRLSALAPATAFALAALAGCVVDLGPGLCAEGRCEPPAPAEPEQAITPLPLNPLAAQTVLYEVQVRTANACDPAVGAEWQREACRNKVAPTIEANGNSASCDLLSYLQRIKLGTLDDLREDTADYRQGITLRYLDERLGVNALWLMPIFPNNDEFGLSWSCDDLGSPYAVRDYLHVRASLDRECIAAGRDEDSAEPCFGNRALDRVIADAHARGLRVFLDVALNHLGHNYRMYDAARFTPLRERAHRGDDLGALWRFDETFDEGLLYPDVLDTEAKLNALAAEDAAVADELAALSAHCPDLAGQALVESFGMWRVAFDHERATFDCGPFLEYALPSFYVGHNAYDPSQGVGDNFSGDGYNTWPDVKFLFHQGGHWRQWEFLRVREYAFRVLNHWVSRGVDGFRLDHTTDPFSGLAPHEWSYVLSKVRHYAMRRNGKVPVFIAEEFHDQHGMKVVVDAMTEGYLGDLTGRHGATKDASYVERVIHNMGRFGGQAEVMTTLETHDERRLTDGTGFNSWTGAGFWGIGAAQWSLPMLLMGQEFGEPRRLGFRGSFVLYSRFEGTEDYRPYGDALVDYYGRMVKTRQHNDNGALRAKSYALLRSRWTGEPDARIFAQMKWNERGDVVFVFHNLWEQDVAQAYFLPEWAADAAGLDRSRRYRLTDLLADGRPAGECRTGADLMWELYVAMDASTRAQWLRLETCDP